MNPTYHLIKKSAVSEGILERYREELEKLKAIFASQKCKFSFTMDGWTATTNFGYLAVTAHWIDQQWEFRECTVDFAEVHGDHSGKYLLSLLSLLQKS